MATVALGDSELGASVARQRFAALVIRALRDGRARTLGFAYLFAAVSVIEPVAYRRAYPTVADRINFAHSFAHNQAVVLFYGRAHNLLTVDGYTAWRMGGTLAIFAAVFGMLTAVRALHSQEDSGRAELVLATPVSRASAFAVGLCAIGAGTVLLWAAAFAGLLAAGLPAGGSAYLALAMVSVVPVLVGAGALASEPTGAVELGGAVVAGSVLLR